ncbi:hypothetical protein AT246_02525 [Bartonella henselae]|nr:hypothetical protein AT247_06260 [Bartonella henselae]OLL56547.1 hypothetical protein AT246_02525 [Bartonella henselae]
MKGRRDTIIEFRIPLSSEALKTLEQTLLLSCNNFFFSTTGLDPMAAKQNAIGLPIHGFILKRHLLMYPNPFRDGIYEGYNNKSIGHHLLYTYDASSQQHHTILPTQNIAPTLGT